MEWGFSFGTRPCLQSVGPPAVGPAVRDSGSSAVAVPGYGRCSPGGFDGSCASSLDAVPASGVAPRIDWPGSQGLAAASAVASVAAVPVDRPAPNSTAGLEHADMG